MKALTTTGLTKLIQLCKGAFIDKASTSTVALATVATSGDYNDLNNLPTIPAAQVNSDWDANSGVAEILNKPTTLAGYGITDGANTSLSNITSAGKKVCANMAMPSSTYDNLTLGASGSTYTAPADGWIYLSKVANATDQYISMNGKFAAVSQAYAAGVTLILSLPASKGNIITIWYSANGTTNDFKFIYANGAV